LNANTPGTIVILLLTVTVSLLALYGKPKLIEANLFRPYYVVRNTRYYTFLTSGLIHGGVPHLALNMLTFYFFGPPLERVIGTGRFVLLYVLSLVMSEVRTYIQHRNDSRFAALGASGAVSAVLFAAIVYFPTQSLFILPIPIPIPAPLFAVGYLAYSWYSSRHSQDGINHTAHIDGALTGLLFVAVTDADAYRRSLVIITH
jgi:membrane associated rhomboid family serine protease